MHLENRYADSQKIPLYVGVPLFVLSYLESTIFAIAAGSSAVDYVPVVGSFASAVDSFDHVAKNTGPHAVTNGILDGVLGVSSVSNGIMQGIGVGLSIYGISQLSKGPRPHLVPNGSARLTIRPLLVTGNASFAGVGLTLTGF